MSKQSSRGQSWDNIHAATQAIWAGEEKAFWARSAQVPVVNGVTYHYDSVDEWYDVSLGKKDGHIYSRNTNPTVAVFEEKLRVLEGAEAATSFATGMAAISNSLFAFLKPGDRVVSIKDAYGGTNKLFLDFLPRLNVDVTLCESDDHEELEREIAKGCQVVYLETPTNPVLKVLDIARLCTAAHQQGAVVMVDNTFATPLNQNPLALGADLVLHSATKFLGGHSDALGGIACGSKKLIDTVFAYREITGATLSADSAYSLLRGMKTLGIRIERQNASALALARFLSDQERVDEVYYPGLESHRGHTIAKKQMRGFGGVLSFSLKGDFDAVRRFLPKLRFAHMAASLGSVGTLVGPPRTTSHVEVSAAEREALGIPESLIRFSVGIEDIDDIIKDVKQALDSLQ